MINISQAKKIRRDICRTMGHEWEEIPVVDLKPGQEIFNEQCTRCKKKFWTAWGARFTIPTAPIAAGPKVKYADLKTKKFNILDRAKDRARDSDKT